jgi:hypothetical protein
MTVYVVLERHQARSLSDAFTIASRPASVVGVFYDELEATRLAAESLDRWCVPAEPGLAVTEVRQTDPVPVWWPVTGKWGGKTGWHLHLVHCRPDRCDYGCDCPHHNAAPADCA